MMTKDIDPAEIGKQAQYIQMAQEEIYELDVLVCGRCHGAFHFVEDFQDHKQISHCEKDSTIRKCNESKAQVWAFLLWKATQIAANSEYAGSHNSWKLYQTWIKLDPSLRETWVVAGTTIQSFNKLGSGTLQEMPVKITKTVVDSPKPIERPVPPLVKPQVAIAPKVAEVKKDPQPIRAIQPTLVPISQKVNMTTSTPLPSKPNRRAKRTDPNTNTIKDEVVEKIVAKRFNPRKKCYEYLVKWECFSHDTGNTWEIHEHLEKVPQILEIFEKQLARQKEQRALQQLAKESGEKKSQPLHVVKKEEVPDLVAMAAGLAGVKRKLNDSDYDDTTMADEDVEEDLPQHTLKKLKNGNNISVKVETKVEQQSPLVAKKPVHIAPKVVQNGPKAAEGADVIVIKDGNKTGIVKKSGNVTVQPLAKGEAQLRLLPKTEITTKSGIVRIDSNQIIVKKTTTPQKIAPAPAQPVRRSIGNVQITPVNRNSPVQKQSPQQHHQTIQKKPTPTNQVTRTVQRTSMSPSQPSPPITKTVQRIAQRTAQHQQQQQQQQNTPEQKILQLSKSGDLRVTKKTGTTPPARKSMPASNVRIQKVQQVHPASPSIDSESSNGALTVCPTTGNLIQEQEEEEIEEEMSHNDLEQQMLQAAAQAAEAEAEQEQEQEEQTQTLDLNSLEQPMVNEDGSPILVSGEDGTIYQVAGKNAEGQTILIAQGADGEQQFAYVASDEIESQVAAAVGAAGMTLENNQGEELTQEQIDSGEYQEIYQQSEEGGEGTGVDQPLMIETGNSDEGNIPAEVVRAEAPSPGGTRKVVLLLQDGTFVVTEMHDDEYQALNIAN
ncbi:Chro family protein [Megaselia abdita]